jgi:uncharacterized membrane protein YuzA (DUF378 family)
MTRRAPVSQVARRFRSRRSEALLVSRLILLKARELHCMAMSITPEPVQRPLAAGSVAGASPMERSMKFINILTLILVIVGGLNWGLVGLFDFDLVATIFGAGSALARIVYIVVGVSALWQLIPLAGAFGIGPENAERTTGSR